MNESERISLASKVAMIMLKHTSCLGLKFDHVNASYEIVDKLLAKLKEELGMEETVISGLVGTIAKLKEKDGFNLSMIAKLKEELAKPCVHRIHPVIEMEAEIAKLKEELERANLRANDMVAFSDETVKQIEQLQSTLDKIKKLDLSKVKRFTGTKSGDSNEEHNEIVNTLQRLLDEGKK